MPGSQSNFDPGPKVGSKLVWQLERLGLGVCGLPRNVVRLAQDSAAKTVPLAGIGWDPVGQGSPIPYFLSTFTWDPSPRKTYRHLLGTPYPVNSINNS